jgi:hypothetical protein
MEPTLKAPDPDVVAQPSADAASLAADRARFVTDTPEARPAVNTSEGAVTPTPASPTDAPKTVQKADAPAQPEGKPAVQPLAEGVNPEVTTEQPKQMSDRANKRIRQLSGELKQARTEQPAAQATPGGEPSAPPPAPTIQPFQMPNIAEGEYTPEQIQQMVVQAAGALTQAQMQQFADKLTKQVSTTLESRDYARQVSDDVSYIETKYPELNEDSSDFNEDLALHIRETYDTASNGGKRRSISLRSIADAQMAIVKKAVEKASANNAATLAQQAASSAVTPGQQTPKSENLWTMPLDDLKKRLGTV